jgi:hypothetical protein
MARKSAYHGSISFDCRSAVFVFIVLKPNAQPKARSFAASRLRLLLGVFD